MKLRDELALHGLRPPDFRNSRAVSKRLGEGRLRHLYTRLSQP